MGRSSLFFQRSSNRKRSSSSSNEASAPISSDTVAAPVSARKASAICPPDSAAYEPHDLAYAFSTTDAQPVCAPLAAQYDLTNANSPFFFDTGNALST